MSAKKLLALILALLTFGVVSAQDVVPAATEEVPSLESVTANHETYYGQEVTLEGVIQELINVRVFVLGEDAALDDDKVLVINNSGQEFDLRVQKGQRATVTGVVYPSVNEGGVGQISSAAPPVMDAAVEVAPDTSVDPALEATEDMSGAVATLEVPDTGETMATEDAADMGDMATEEAAPTPAPDMGNDTSMTAGMTQVDFSSMVLPDEYNDFTIVVITSLDAISYIDPEPLPPA